MWGLVPAGPVVSCLDVRRTLHPGTLSGGTWRASLEFETLISDLSSRFINLPPDEVDREIEDGLRRVCEPLGIDLAVLWQWSAAAPGVIVPTHAYCAEEGLRPTDPMRQEQYPWSVEQLLAGRLIAASSLEDLPAEAAVDRETCRRFGIQSALCIPLSVGGEPPVAPWASTPCARSATGRTRWSSGCSWSRRSSRTRSFAGATS